jgi:hypothetical protein
MKKLYLFIFVFLLGISLIFAAGENALGGTNGNDNSSGDGNQVITQTGNQGESSQLQVQTQSEFGFTIRAQNGTVEAKTEMKMTQQQDGNQ